MLTYKYFNSNSECPLFYNLVYPRYITDLVDFDFIPFEYKIIDEGGENDIIDINKESELYWQETTFVQKTLKAAQLNNLCGFVSFNNEEFVLNLDDLLDDKDCFIKLSCGTWVGNTNYSERVIPMKQIKIENNKYTVTLKKIWGFEPDLVEDAEDLTPGIINGFSKKKYSLFVSNEDAEDTKYYPTLFGKLMTDEQIEQIISSKDSYPSGKSDVLYVSD